MSNRRLHRIPRPVREVGRGVLAAAHSVFGDRNARSFADWRDYLRPQQVAGYIGWVGHQNLGDEALYGAFRELFPQHQLLLFNAAPPVEMLLHSTFIKRRRLHDLVFLGGGTLLLDPHYLRAMAAATRRFGKRTVIFGTGVRDPTFWGTRLGIAANSAVVREWCSAISEAWCVGVRGPRTARLLEELGLPRPEVLGDPMLAMLEARPRGFVRRKKAGINVGCLHQMWGRQAQVNGAVAELCRSLLRESWEVEFLAFHAVDALVARQLIRDFGLPPLPIHEEHSDISIIVRRIRELDLVVAQRLHAAVAACATGVPTVSLAYEPKCIDFMESIERGRFAVRTDVVTGERLLAMAEVVDTDYEEHCAHLRAACGEFRSRQRRAAAMVTESLAA